MALLNVTLDGISVEKEIGLDFYASSDDIKRVALEELRTGGLPGLVRPDAHDAIFADFVVDPTRTPEGNERLFLRPKTAFGNKVRPLHDHVLVEAAPAEAVSKGGIIIPDNAQEKQAQGKVVAVGKGAIRPDGTVRALDVKVGDRVLYGRYAGSEVTIDGAKYQMLREEEIHAVLGE